MTKIAILADPADSGELAYRAVAGRHHSSGKTAGEALDALTSRLDSQDLASVVIVRHLRPDKFFSAEQLSRLTALMQKWREARETGAALPDREQTELEELVDMEVRAAGERTAELLREVES